jgi:hypothetical protein
MTTYEHSRRHAISPVKPVVDYNRMPTTEFINSIKLLGNKAFKILRELNEQQINIYNHHVSILLESRDKSRESKHWDGGRVLSGKI